MTKAFKETLGRYLRDTIFGLEDGMISTLGAITGIAVGVRDHTIVLLSGIVVICVESISMTAGTFLASRSHMESLKKKIQQEIHEIRTDPEGERKELEEMYRERGFPPEERDMVIKRIMSNEELLLEEMMFRELGIGSESFESPVKNSIAMFFAYIAGGFIPLCAYFFWDIPVALPASFGWTMAALFSIGALSSHYSTRPWWRLGSSFLLIGGFAAAVGYAVGRFLHYQFGLSA